MGFLYTYESFSFGGEGQARLRPKSVEGSLSVDALMGDKRDSKVQPLALYPAGNTSNAPDFPPHNTEAGHLVGLEHLGGDHDSRNLVPMYGNFNKSKYKKEVENVWIEAVQRTEGVTGAKFKIEVVYDNLHDPRIPTGFRYQLEVAGSNPKSIIKVVSHPAPALKYVAPPNGFLDYLSVAYSFMEHQQWFVEDNIKGYAWSPKNNLHGHKLVVPDRNYNARPYAVVDYILYGSAESEAEKFLNFVKSFDLDRLNSIGYQARPELANGLDFTEDQKTIIRAVNVVLYKGFIKSDCKDDYVYDGCNVNVYQSKKYSTTVVTAMTKVVGVDRTNYNLTNQNATAPEGTLSFDGSHQYPEVDHIQPQTYKSNDFGCNAYSNAMVVSMFYNNQMRTKLKKDLKMQLY